MSKQEITEALDKTVSWVQKLLWIVIAILSIYAFIFKSEDSLFMGLILIILWLAQLEFVAFILYKNRGTLYSYVVLVYFSLLSTLLLKSSLGMITGNLTANPSLTIFLTNFSGLLLITLLGILAIYTIYEQK